jgi:hypothetical protein
MIKAAKFERLVSPLLHFNGKGNPESGCTAPHRGESGKTFSQAARTREEVNYRNR